eukprot:1543231-Pyramimonas_sp.AAC.1
MGGGEALPIGSVFAPGKLSAGRASLNPGEAPLAVGCSDSKCPGESQLPCDHDVALFADCGVDALASRASRPRPFWAETEVAAEDSTAAS